MTTGRATLRAQAPFLRLAWRDLRSSGRYLWVFWVCLMLGVTLVAASGGMFRQVSGGLLADSRALFGGDVVVDSRAPLDSETLEWMRERGEVSLVTELRTMMMSGGGTQLVELLSMDAAYPLYGTVELTPALSLLEATRETDGQWGAVLDPVLAARLSITPGDEVSIGAHTMTVRALVARQPDRALSADWRGPPVLVAAGALASSGLLLPGSRLDYEYRVKLSAEARTDADPRAWAESLARAFPAAEFEIRTVLGREDRIAEVLAQAASGLLLLSGSVHCSSAASACSAAYGPISTPSSPPSPRCARLACAMARSPPCISCRCC